MSRRVQCIRRIFKHAVASELIDVAVVQRLDSLELLKRGQTKAKAPERVQPVDLKRVKKTAVYLSPVVQRWSSFMQQPGCDRARCASFGRAISIEVVMTACGSIDRKAIRRSITGSRVASFFPTDLHIPMP